MRVLSVRKGERASSFVPKSCCLAPASSQAAGLFFFYSLFQKESVEKMKSKKKTLFSFVFIFPSV
jgi:hypothetical protein